MRTSGKSSQEKNKLSAGEKNREITTEQTREQTTEQTTEQTREKTRAYFIFFIFIFFCCTSPAAERQFSCAQSGRRGAVVSARPGGVRRELRRINNN
jgi:hypothetical protein